MALFLAGIVLKIKIKNQLDYQYNKTIKLILISFFLKKKFKSRQRNKDKVQNKCLILVGMLQW